MNSRMLRKPLVVLGVVAAAALAALLATEARATPQRNAAAVGRSASQPQHLLPTDAGSVSAFAFDPTNPNIVYVGTVPGYNKGRVYKSTDAGEHWRLISGTGWTWLGALAGDPKHRGTLYAGTGNAVYKTTDGGHTWRAFSRGLLPPPGINRGEGWVQSLAVDPDNSNIVYANTGGGVRKSVDGGRNWQTVLWHSRFGFTLSTLVAATRPATVYVAFGKFRNGPPDTPDLSLYSSTDGAKTWQRTRLHVALRSNDANGLAVALAADPQLPTTLYAAAQAHICMSTDAGRRWHFIGQGLPQDGDVTSLAAGPGTVYAVLGKDGIYETTDAGQTWTHSWPQSGSAPGLGVSVLAIDLARPTTVYASAYYPSPDRATGTHILRSTDNGRTWTVVG
jgi:photosystem II stability/assembly factor-like uncharacterized protein